MPEPRLDMFPDGGSQPEKPTPEIKSEEVQLPKEGLPAEKKEEESAESSVPEGKPPKGYVSYQSLEEERRKRREERDKRRELEQEIATLKTSHHSFDEDEEDEDHDELPTSQELDSLRREVAEMKRSQTLTSLHSQYPVLTEYAEDFDQYLEENDDLPIDKAAKLFLVERDLISGSTERKGLEQPTAGDKTPVPDGTPADEAMRLMQTSPRAFIRKIRSGELDPDKIY